MGGAYGPDSGGNCGKCYQYKITKGTYGPHPSFKKSDGSSGNPSPPQIPVIFQAVNTGFDVKQNHFDVQMGGGGFGYFDGCNKDCTSRSTSCSNLGGPCKGGLYGGTFYDWTFFKSGSERTSWGGDACYDGGIRIDHIQQKNLSVKKACQMAAGGSAWKDQTFIEACSAAIDNAMHWNWDVMYTRVACPDNLTKLTGYRPSDDAGQPKPSKGLSLGTKGEITSMQDCCKASCSWGNKGNFDRKFNAVTTCDKNGFPYLPGVTKPKGSPPSSCSL
jgi:hypothetical protein